MDIVRTIGALLLSGGVALGIKAIWGRLDKLKASSARRARYRRYKRKFREGQATVDAWRAENPPKVKKQNIIVKDPKYAAVWGVGV